MRPKRTDAVSEIATTDKFRMLSGHQQYLPKSLCGQIAGLRDYLVEGKCDPQDGVVARKSAVTAIVDTFVAQIKRREHPHGATEVLLGQSACLLRHRLEANVIDRRKEGSKTPDQQ